ncbi:MAG TPA: signal recognition particle-docking protein FtsY [Chloroflexi bacterium]|nr:signal recognition particle-docking protein FtsY [Chloroflexota bacterium]
MTIGFAQSLKDSLTRTRNTVFSRIANLLGASQVTEETWDELEGLLIQADVGVETTLHLIEQLRRRASEEAILQTDTLQTALREELRALLPDPPPLDLGNRPLDVILIVGVNGSGKTTSIAKLAYCYKQQGRQVLLAAADTFRAAAMDQLGIWAGRAGVNIITGSVGGDPGAIIFDALQSAQARGMDLVIADTAGRLHTQYNLMAELGKIRTVAAKNVPTAPHETLLVLDATTGQNALSQAKHFQQAVDVTGVILAKLDSTAKGGMVFAIARELGLPVRFVGTGERIEHLAPFDADVFIDGLLGPTNN